MRPNLIVSTAPVAPPGSPGPVALIEVAAFPVIGGLVGYGLGGLVGHATIGAVAGAVGLPLLVMFVLIRVG